MSDQNIAKETVGNKDSRANSGPWEPFRDDKGAEENRDPSDASGPGAQGRDLCPSLPPPFEEVLGAPWVGKTMKSPWKGRTYPGDPWGHLLPFIGPTQAFPVNVNPGGNGPAAWYPWEANDLKELKKAVAEDGPNSPWAEAILQGLAHQPCTTQNWKMLCKAVLPSNTYLQWCAFLKEECHAQAERNKAANPAIPVTFGMLSGTADQWSTGPQQATIPAPYTRQVWSICLAAWKKLAEGPSEPPISGITQKNNEDLSTFIDWVEKSIQRKFPPGPLRDQFVRLLVWEGMNSDHKLACAGQNDHSIE